MAGLLDECGEPWDPTTRTRRTVAAAAVCTQTRTEPFGKINAHSAPSVNQISPAAKHASKFASDAGLNKEKKNPTELRSRQVKERIEISIVAAVSAAAGRHGGRGGEGGRASPGKARSAVACWLWAVVVTPFDRGDSRGLRSAGYTVMSGVRVRARLSWTRRAKDDAARSPGLCPAVGGRQLPGCPSAGLDERVAVRLNSAPGTPEQTAPGSKSSTLSFCGRADEQSCSCVRETGPDPAQRGAGPGSGVNRPPLSLCRCTWYILGQKCEGVLPAEYRSFAVDPQITSLEVLQHILIRAFELNGYRRFQLVWENKLPDGNESAPAVRTAPPALSRTTQRQELKPTLEQKRNFGISYLSRDKQGVEAYLSLMSDWDLDAAFVSAAKPYLQLKIDIKPSEDSPLLEDWDIISPKDVISSDLIPGERRSLAAAALPFTQSLISQVGRTLSRVQQALSWSYGEDVKPFKPPLSDSEFHSFLSHLGQLTRPEELRLRIYHGGVEPSLRKVVWRYLLNVYPDGLTGQERMDYMKRKTREYDRLKGEWSARASPEDLEFIRGNVLKDVLRTDRAHPYYAGSEDSPHLAALADLLTTYAITHPQVSYCQGMSDIASPILAVMDNEAHAFICFCGIMKRLEGNFRPDGQLISVKFQHLKLLLRYSDPEFYAYLVSRGADDLFFCYRWLLLELKREFAFEDALRMLEVTWSSLPPDPPETEVELLGPPLQEEEEEEAGRRRKGEQRRRHMLRPSREELAGPAGEREDGDGGRPEQAGGEGSSAPPLGDSFDLEEEPPTSPGTPLPDRRTSLPSRQPTEDSEEDPGESEPLIRPGESISTPASGGRRSPNGQTSSPTSSPSLASGRVSPSAPAGKHPVSSPSLASGRLGRPSSSPCVASGRVGSPAAATGRSLVSSPVFSDGRAGSPSTPTGKTPMASPCPGTRSASPKTATPSTPVPDKEDKPAPAPSLPPPQEFGKGNPFMLFLCLSILLEHRDHIIKNNLDYNELAMHFDRLVRKHNLNRVLQRAKALFANYLQSEVWDSEEGDEASSDSPAAQTPQPQPPPPNPNSTYNLSSVYSPSSSSAS
ncbi:TBC25 protein, partial [Atractosteus spatula]|nr:TBC25 protein [Atractosteus spatula]